MTSKPNRAAIYARFSSDLQDARSVTDQVAMCRDYAKRQGWTIVQVHADEAISGASIHGRAGLARLVDDAKRGAFDLILLERIDRLSRNAADTIRLREQMDFIGIEIHTCASGLVTEMHAGLEGLMSAMYLRQLAVHVRRGQAGRVREGLSGGGLTYGYAPVPGRRGERIIVEAEAEIVRRVFAEYVAGRTPRDIAIDLNRERVPSPRGDFWSASTIHGNRKRGSGCSLMRSMTGAWCGTRSLCARIQRPASACRGSIQKRAGRSRPFPTSASSMRRCSPPRRLGLTSAATRCLPPPANHATCF